MTDIPTTLATLAAEIATLQTALASATADGGKASSKVKAINTASAALAYLSNRTDTEAKQVTAWGTQITAALADRANALAAVKKAHEDGAHPLLADAEDTSLKGAVATANGVSPSDLHSKAVAKVTELDNTIAGLGSSEAATLKSAQDTVAAKQTTLAEKRADAEAIMVEALKASSAGPTAKLAAAQAAFDRAKSLSAATDAASKHTAVVAYADYAAAKAALVSELTTDPTESAAKAKSAWLTALIDAADAEEKVIEAQLALDTKLAEKAARQATRDPDAVAVVTAALAPPAPPPSDGDGGP